MKPITPAMRRALFHDDGYGRLRVRAAMAQALEARGLVDRYHAITDHGRRIRALAAVEMAAEGVKHPHMRAYLRDTDWALGHIAAGLPAPDDDRLDEALGLLDFEFDGSGPALYWARLAVVLPWPLDSVSARWRRFVGEHADQVLSPILARTIEGARSESITVRGMRRAMTMFTERVMAAEARERPADGWIEALSIAAACALGLPGEQLGSWTSPLARTVASYGPSDADLHALATAIDGYDAAGALARVRLRGMSQRLPRGLRAAVEGWAFDARAAAGGPLPTALLGGALTGMPDEPTGDPPAATAVECDRMAALLWSGEPRIGDAVWWFDGQTIRSVPLRDGLLDFEAAGVVEGLPPYAGIREALPLLEHAGRISAADGLLPDTPQIESEGSVWWFDGGALVCAPVLAEGELAFDNLIEADPDFYPEDLDFHDWLARNGS